MFACKQDNIVENWGIAVMADGTVLLYGLDDFERM